MRDLDDITMDLAVAKFELAQAKLSGDCVRYKKLQAKVKALKHERNQAVAKIVEEEYR